MAEPKITPLARRLAEENGIDWRRLQGTGPDGTIVERDVLAFLAKLMAGEVDLPPMPETPPPLPPEEELRRAREALGKEGVDLADLIPEAPLQVEEVAEEELDLDLDLEEEEALLLAEEAPGSLEAWEEDLLAPKTPSKKPLLEDEEELLRALEEEPPPVPEKPQGEVQVFPPPPPPAPGVAPAPAPIPAPAALRVYRRRVELRGLEEALALFAQVHGVPKTPLPFLLRAAERALAELEIPLRALVGRVEGEGVRGLRPPATFLALFRESGGEEVEGLLCFAGEEEVHTGRPSLFLAPEGLLTASGLEAPLARKLLERVALYLEHPLLLLA
jgi:pyruvate/2-oxoglutarate dehydrogenase complex dihydrolipoamide acyltransferase (E2) component